MSLRKLFLLKESDERESTQAELAYARLHRAIDSSCGDLQNVIDSYLKTSIQAGQGRVERGLQALPEVSADYDQRAIDIIKHVIEKLRQAQN